MTRRRLHRAVRMLATMPIAAAATACSGSLPWLRGDLANHPPAVIGQWVDVLKSSPADSSFWVLRPDGEDDGVRIIRDAPGAMPRQSRSHYGYWYVRALGSGGHELCVSRRPSRDAPSCTPFVAGVDSIETPPRRTLRLASYTGAHHTGERLLIERR